jgi:hypothetical protein
MHIQLSCQTHFSKMSATCQFNFFSHLSVICQPHVSQTCLPFNMWFVSKLFRKSHFYISTFLHFYISLSPYNMETRTCPYLTKFKIRSSKCLLSLSILTILSYVCNSIPNLIHISSYIQAHSSNRKRHDKSSRFNFFFLYYINLSLNMASVRPVNIKLKNRLI